MRIMSTDEKGNTKYYCSVCDQPNRLVDKDGVELKVKCGCVRREI